MSARIATVTETDNEVYPSYRESSSNSVSIPTLERLPHDVLCRILIGVCGGIVEGIPMLSETRLDEIQKCSNSIREAFHSATFWSSVLVEIRHSDLLQLPIQNGRHDNDKTLFFNSSSVLSWHHLRIQRLKLHWPNEGFRSYRWHDVCHILAANFTQLRELEIIHDDPSTFIPLSTLSYVTNLQQQQQHSTTIQFPLSPSNLVDQLCCHLLIKSSDTLHTLSIQSNFSPTNLPARVLLFPTTLRQLRRVTLSFTYPSYLIDQLLALILLSPLISLRLSTTTSSHQLQPMGTHRCVAFNTLETIECNLGGWTMLSDRIRGWYRHRPTAHSNSNSLKSLLIRLDDSVSVDLTIHQLCGTLVAVGDLINYQQQSLQSIHIIGCWTEELQWRLLNCLFASPIVLKSLRHLNLTCSYNYEMQLSSPIPSVSFPAGSDQLNYFQGFSDLFRAVVCHKLDTLCLQSVLLSDLISLLICSKPWLPCLQYLCIQRISTSTTSSFVAAAELKEFFQVISLSNVESFYFGRLGGCLKGLDIPSLLLSTTAESDVNWERETEGLHSHDNGARFALWRRATPFYWKKRKCVAE